MARTGKSRGWLLVIGLLAAAGCGTSADPGRDAGVKSWKGLGLTVAAVGDPAILATVAAERGEWAASRKADVTVLDKPVDPGAIPQVDVLLFRGDQLGALVDAGALVPIPESVTSPPLPPNPEETPEDSTAQPPSDPLQFKDVVPAYRNQVSKYGAVRMALPYGGSALVLAYHREAFERPETQEAARAAKVALEPPRTWTELDALARFLHGRDWNGDGKTDAGIALALGEDAEGVADATYLARAASLGQHRDQYSFLFDADSMAPRIASPPFVAALEGLTALKDCGPPDMAKFDARAARRAFSQGETALLIDRAERVAEWGGGKSIAVAPLPGSERVFDPARKAWEDVSPPNQPEYLPYGGGWLVGVSARTSGAKREAAIDFARYLISPQAASRVRADRDFPMLAVRTALIGQGPPNPRAARGVDGRLWSDAVSRTLMAARVVPGLRIPGTHDYLADLARGRLAALGGTPAAEALKTVAQAWTERTEKLGTARQLWHYRRSLNSLATLPTPPER
jgi:multiple sugar transport system substrate-binding protein